MFPFAEIANYLDRFFSRPRMIICDCDRYAQSICNGNQVKKIAHSRARNVKCARHSAYRL